MQYMFEKENIFYDEKCNTTEIRDRCMANCAVDPGGLDLQGQSKLCGANPKMS